MTKIIKSVLYTVYYRVNPSTLLKAYSGVKGGESKDILSSKEWIKHPPHRFRYGMESVISLLLKGWNEEAANGRVKCMLEPDPNGVRPEIFSFSYFFPGTTIMRGTQDISKDAYRAFSKYPATAIDRFLQGSLDPQDEYRDQWVLKIVKSALYAEGYRTSQHILIMARIELKRSKYDTILQTSS
jgi:hypothetical protein